MPATLTEPKSKRESETHVQSGEPLDLVLALQSLGKHERAIERLLVDWHSGSFPDLLTATCAMLVEVVTNRVFSIPQGSTVTTGNVLSRATIRPRPLESATTKPAH